MEEFLQCWKKPTVRHASLNDSFSQYGIAGLRQNHSSSGQFWILRIMAFCSYLSQLHHDSFSFELIMQPIRHGGCMDWLIVNAISQMKISPKTHKARHLSCLKKGRNKEEEALRGKKKKQPEKSKVWTKTIQNKKEEHASQMSITIIRPAMHCEKQSTKRK